MLCDRGVGKESGDRMSTRVWEIPWLPYPTSGLVTSEVLEGMQGLTVRGLMKDGGR